MLRNLIVIIALGIPSASSAQDATAPAIPAPPAAGAGASPDVPPGPGAPPADTVDPETRSGITGICGTVVEAAAREPLIEAQVKLVKGGEKAVRTDVDGKYVIPLPPGEYDARAHYELHRPRRVAGIAVEQGKCTVVDFALAADASAVEEVVVVARADKRREEAVLAERKKAAPVSDAISAQEISRTPDSAASDAVKRVVSATVVDGKYVFLRGLGGRYSGVLLNGVPLPSPDPDERSAPLDIFPASLLSNLTVVKTYTSDLPGGFGGGALLIETTPYPTKLEARVKLSTGFDSNSTFKDIRSYEGGRLDRLGFDDGTRKLPGAVPTGGPVTNADSERAGESFSNRWTTTTENGLPAAGFAATLGDTGVLLGRTAGYLATVAYGTKSFARESFSGRVREDGGELIYRDSFTNEIGGTSSTISALANGGIELSPGDRISALVLYTHTGESLASVASGSSRLDNQDLLSTRLQFVSRGLLFGQLMGTHGLFGRALELSWQANASLTTRDEPDTRDVTQFDDAGTLVYKTGVPNGIRFYSELQDIAGGGELDLEWPLGNSRLRAGASVQASTREFRARRFLHKYVGSDPSVLRLPANELLSAAHIGEDIAFEEDTRQSDGYDASLLVAAGYLSADWAPLERLRVIAGLRYELADQTLTPGTIFATDGSGPPEMTRNDGDLLPSLNVVYALRPDLNLRAAYSYTLVRPLFRELAPFIYFDYTRRRGIEGNPELEKTRIHNVDARAEWFPSTREVLAASAFYKHFQKPIELTVSSAAQGDLKYRNAPQADVYGVELEARASLGRLWSPLDSLLLSTNVSLIESQVDFGGNVEGEVDVQTNDRRPLQGQSPYVVNVALTWDAPANAELSVLYNVYGRRIAEVGYDRLPDTYEQPFHRLDLTYGQGLGKSFKLKAAVTNLLDEEIVLNQGGLDVLRYRPGVAGSISLEWSR
jgi:outer membrane receptor protein involved in Fe transport